MAYSSIAGPQRFPTLAFEFTLAGGWEKVGIEGLLWEDNTKLAFAVPDAVYRDPCNFSLGIVEPPAGSSIADLTEGLLELPSWEVETVEWDAYHGFLGNHVQLTAPADLSGCDQPVAIMRTPGWPGIIEVPFEGALLDFWILNVRGTSLVIYTVTEPDAPEQERAALSAVLESIRITP